MQTSHQHLHNQALQVVSRYKKSEVELIEILEKIDRYKVYYNYGYNSLFQYAVKALGLSEEVAYIFINVSRKTREVPELKEQIKQGHITVSKAKKITSVLTTQNQRHWLELAKTCSKQKLEKQVAQASPKQSVREQMNYVHPTQEVKEKAKLVQFDSIKPQVRVQLQVGVSEEVMLKLRRVQDILSQKRKRPVGLEEALANLTDLFIEKQDPLEKAKRQKLRGKLQGKTSEQVPGLVGPSQRQPLPASIKHQLMLKHQGQCTHTDHKGYRCSQRRFLEAHHITPVSQGGDNSLANLTLLCSGHHKATHHLIV